MTTLKKKYFCNNPNREKKSESHSFKECVNQTGLISIKGHEAK